MKRLTILLTSLVVLLLACVLDPIAGRYAAAAGQLECKTAVRPLGMGFPRRHVGEAGQDPVEFCVPARSDHLEAPGGVRDSAGVA